MKNFFSIIIIFAVLLVGGGVLYLKKQAEEQRVQLAEDLASVRRSFAHKARSAANEEDDRYVSAMKGALKSYEEDLKRTVYDEQPEARDPEKYKKMVDEKFEKGEMDEARRKSMLEGYEIVKDAYDTLMAGNWRPVLTAKGKADTRLDIYTLRQIADDEGRPVLEGKFFFWGIEDSTQVSWGDLTLRLWKKEMEMVKEGRKKVEKEVEKVLGRAEGEAQPRLIIQRPGKYVDDFPSFVSVGRIWLPVLPHEAVMADLEYIYTTRVQGGGEVESVLAWEKLDIPRGWKLGEGQDWDADEIEATEDEIAGKDPEEAAEGEAAAAAAAEK